MAKHVEMINEYLVEDDSDDFKFFDNYGLLIRCRDCNKQTYFGEGKLHCELLDRIVCDDFYCGYGELEHE